MNANGVRSNPGPHNTRVATTDSAGLLHSVNDDPSREVFDSRDAVTRYEWHKHGKLHRDGDLPAVETKDVYGYLRESHWLRDGIYGREDPSDPHMVLRMNPGMGSASKIGPVLEMSWRDERGRTHRDGGPAIINPKGWGGPPDINFLEAWYQDGMPHREDGPAYVRPEGKSDLYMLRAENVTRREFLGWKLGVRVGNTAALDFLGDEATLETLTPGSPDVVIALEVFANL